MSQREYDLVIFGATGFTGRLTAQYLARRARKMPFRLAIAGRDESKLQRVQDSLREIYPEFDAGTIVADLEDPASLREMAESTSVLATTVGPYGRYGEPVVSACVAAATHYTDITGEPQFVRRMLENYGLLARENGVRIVNCCGFDSIPHDLGALFTVRQLPREVPVRLEGFVLGEGGFSGGTWQSAVEAMAGAHRWLPQELLRGRSLESQDGRRARALIETVRYVRDLGCWASPLPTIDSSIVLRSAQMLDDFGPDFRYGHYVRVPSLAKLAAGSLAVGGIFAAAQFKPTRRWLLSLRPSGSGPRESTRQRSRFSVVFLGRGGGQTVRTEVSGGDPGYGETSKMLAEASLTLALDQGRLPERFGVLTPAAAMGDVLLERLQAAGIRFEVLGD